MPALLYGVLITQQQEISIMMAMLHARKQKHTKFKRLPWPTQLAKKDPR